METEKFKSGSNFAQAAQSFVAHGIAIFPLHPKTKIPSTPNGVKDASTNPEETAKRWNQQPNANIGIAAGASDFLILDIDGDIGEATYREHAARLGELPETVTVITPGKIKKGRFLGKGKHLYFRNPSVKIIAKANFVPGIDIRSNNTYVVAPPSIHPDGTGAYEFEPGKDFNSIPVADIPSAWLEILPKDEGVEKKKQERTAHSAPHIPLPSVPLDPQLKKRVYAYIDKCDGAEQGGAVLGHNTLLSVANALVNGFCLDPDTAAEIAWERYNPKCSPPWTYAEKRDFDRKFRVAADNQPNKERGYLLKGKMWSEYQRQCGKRAKQLMFEEMSDQATTTENTLSPSPNTPYYECGIECLDTILSRLEPVDWEKYQIVGCNKEIKPPSERDYILRPIERILATADSIGSPMVYHTGVIYYWTGTHYTPLPETALRNFLIAAAIRCGVPYDTAIFQYFVEKLYKQFLIIAAMSSRVQEPNGTYINLKNVVLFFDRKGHHPEPHSSTRFIRYVLNFDYDPSATAPLWQSHLDRSLPIPEKQQYLAECLALPFYQGKIEKAPVFYGQRDTGKSTTLDVYKELIGQVSPSGGTVKSQRVVGQFVKMEVFRCTFFEG